MGAGHRGDKHPPMASRVFVLAFGVSKPPIPPFPLPRPPSIGLHTGACLAKRKGQKARKEGATGTNEGNTKGTTKDAPPKGCFVLRWFALFCYSLLCVALISFALFGVALSCIVLFCVALRCFAFALLCCFVFALLLLLCLFSCLCLMLCLFWFCFCLRCVVLLCFGWLCAASIYFALLWFVLICFDLLWVGLRTKYCCLRLCFRHVLNIPVVHTLFWGS